jgi:LmbE family N-acetylglucosaminyl deacetylase
MRGSSFQKIRAALEAAGMDVSDWPEPDPEVVRRGLESEQRITTTVDIRPVLSRKNKALFAHGSQVSESWFSRVPPEIAEDVFGLESFIRASDRTGAPLPETDLFAGLRPAPGEAS